MRRKVLSVSAALGLLFGALALLAPPSSAQTGYPGTCNTTAGSVDAGSHNVGESFTVTLAPTCAFDPGSNVTVTVNGQSVGTKTASSSGTVNVHITITSSGQVSVDDPVVVNSQCGSNSVVASGRSSVAGSNVTQTASFTINCPASTATANRGTVAFTGANIAKWSAGALVLVAGGFGLVVFARRRRAAGQPTAA